VREFVVSGKLSAADVERLVASRYRAQVRSRSRRRRTWLDTADARLAAAGIELLHVVDDTADAKATIFLTSADESSSAPCAETLPRWPAELPSTVASRVARIADLRALGAHETRDVDALVVNVIDGEAKTVARVALETARAKSAGAPAQHLFVEPLRGYGADAARVEKLLCAGGRVSPAIAGHVTGLPVGPAPSFVRETSVSEALAVILRHQFDVIEANVPGTIAATDTEFLHDLRVGVRRTRSALKLTAGAVPGRLAERFGARFRRLGDLTTPARDLDVLVLDLGPGAAGDDLQPLRDFLAERTAAAYVTLARGLRSAEFRRLATSYRSALDTLEGGRSVATPVGLAADGWAATAMRRVLKRGRRITPDSPATDLHDLRKRCKELRYCLELFGPVWAPAVLSEFVKELKVLQDNLGTFQDTEVQRDMLSHWANEMATQGRAPAATVMAMGRLTADLAVRQQRAHAEFSGRFARFAGTANLRRFETMTAGGAAAARRGASADPA
jgi:CHAD domain-containing protein